MKKLRNQRINYAGLIRELAFTDFKLKYQGSVLGYFWSLVKPLMLFLVLYVVFTKFFRIGSSVEHYPVYLLLGIVVWGFFGEVTAMSLDAIVGRGDLIRKIYFPRMVLIVSKSVTSAMTFALNFLVILIFIFFTKGHIDITAIFFPLVLIELLILVTGISLFLSSLFVKFRDLAHIWEVLMQAMFYATPILYPLSLVPEPINKILILNPVAQIIQDMRYFLVTKQTVTAWTLLGPKYVWIPYILPIFVAIFGLKYFNKSAAKFAEEI